MERLQAPRFVGPSDGTLNLHDQSFVFGPLELEGAKVFFSEPQSKGSPGSALGVGNCAACHAAPDFKDGSSHNTGAAQSEYDALHGAGAFRLLVVPDLRTRNSRFNDFLPPSPKHPKATARFRSVPDASRPGETDLGVWNVFDNPDLPSPQTTLHELLCGSRGRCPDEGDALKRTIATFKTSGLRDLGHSGPYLHTAAAASLEAVLDLYAEFSEQARAGQMRNPDPALLGMRFLSGGRARLAAFLKSLNEDYE